MIINIEYNEDNQGRYVTKCKVLLNGKEYFLSELEPKNREKAIKALNITIRSNKIDKKLEKLGFKRKI